MASRTGSGTTPLRMRMIDAMVLRGFAQRTQEAYVAAVRFLAEHHHSSPEVLSDEQVQDCLLRTYSGGSCSVPCDHIPVRRWQHASQTTPLNLTLPRHPLGNLRCGGSVQRGLSAARRFSALRTLWRGGR